MADKQDDVTTALVKAAVEATTPLFKKLSELLALSLRRLFAGKVRGTRKQPNRKKFSLLVVAVVFGLTAVLLASRKGFKFIRHDDTSNLYVSSMAFPIRPDGAYIFESDQETQYRFPTPEDGVGIEYTPSGGLIKPPKVTKTNPARCTNRVTLDSSKSILFSLKFLTVVPTGHFQIAIGAGKSSGITVQFAYDPLLNIAYLTVKQADYYLPESASPLEMSKKGANGYTVPCYPDGKEFWVLVHVDKGMLGVTLPSGSSSKTFTYKLAAEPELDEQTVVERRSYGSEIQLKHLAIGTPDVLWKIVKGQFKHEGWPELSLNN